jgi:cell division protein ZapA (FtsZ GTPase activity inhibitor)
MSQGHVQIQLLGVSFTINTDEDPEHMARIIDYLKKKIDSTQKLVKMNDPLKVAILTGILLTDELFKERQGDEDAAEAEKLAEKIIHRIDVSLKDIS